MTFIDVKDLKPGEEFTMDLIVQVSSYGSLGAYTMLLDGAIQIAEVQVKVTVPTDFNAVAECVAAIDRQISAHRDEANRKIAPLKEKKAQLLQLAYAGQEILDAEKPE